MSIFGAMQSGISGLAAQSTAMGAISDNIVNVNTVGYKNNNTAFQTLVTKQVTSSRYSSGGVQPVSKQGINVQGLLSSTSSSTDVAISGDGFFVVNQAANPGEGDLWAYTRAGSFDIDNNGYLVNTGGFYAQGWSLLPWDGNPQAATVNINGVTYMKAYYDSTGKTVYINDNIIDNRNLKPINLATIGGTATPTQQISFGANLPSSDTIGSTQKVSALIYDSLGNASNLSLDFTKTSSNGWTMSSSVPSGAATSILYGSNNKLDGSPDVYAASGLLEFTSVPENGSSITITDEGTGTPYEFVFTNNPAGVTGPNQVAVDLSTGIASLSDFIEKFTGILQNTMPGGDRFQAGSNCINITQSTMGAAMSIDASSCLACVQNAVNPDFNTGLPTGIFNIPQIDNDIKNGARIDFTSTTDSDYLNKSLTIDGITYTFTDNDGDLGQNNININISSYISGGEVDVASMLDALQSAINANGIEPSRFTVSGTSLEILPSATGGDIALNLTSLGTAVTGTIRNGGSGAWQTVTNFNGTISNEFSVGENEVEQGSLVPAVRFNADGTPKYFNVDEMSIVWANGAENMDGSADNGTRIKLEMGNTGTNDGLTSLSGNFTTNYIRQDGAKFGSYSGVYIDESGVVTALFDNGETRPIAILPLATFSNPNGMEALTGNAWIETDSSGQALLKRAGSNGAGEISSSSLESSTVDLATEFSNMIVTQRAYSAATKIITTADEMLDELTRMT